MTNSTILAIIGLPGAGKTQTAQYFKKKGYPVISFGEVTNIGLRAQNLSLNEENERAFRENLRLKLGMAVYAKKVEPKIVEALKTSPIVILDGLRSYGEYEYLKKRFKYLKLICIYARPVVRHERLKRRKIRPLSITQAEKRDIAELTNLDMAKPIALSDYVIENNTTIGGLNQKLHELLKEINR